MKKDVQVATIIIVLAALCLVGIVGYIRLTHHVHRTMMYSLLAIDNGFERTVEILDKGEENIEVFSLACKNMSDYVAPMVSSFLSFKRYPLFYKKYDMTETWYFAESLKYREIEEFSKEEVRETIELIRLIDEQLSIYKFFEPKYNFVNDKNKVADSLKDIEMSCTEYNKKWSFENIRLTKNVFDYGL